MESKFIKTVPGVGGDAMTSLLMQQFVEVTQVDPLSLSAVDIQRIRDACDRGRCALSNADDVEVVVHGVACVQHCSPGSVVCGDLSMNVTRATFQRLLMESGLLDVMGAAVESAKLGRKGWASSRSKLGRVIVAGRVAQTPLINTKIREWFEADVLLIRGNVADLYHRGGIYEDSGAATKGAACLAAILMGKTDPWVRTSLLLLWVAV